MIRLVLNRVIISKVKGVQLWINRLNKIKFLIIESKKDTNRAPDRQTDRLADFYIPPPPKYCVIGIHFPTIKKQIGQVCVLKH